MASPPGATAPSAGPRGVTRLLVIDEDEKRARAMAAEMEQEGFAVRCAGDGPAGFALLAQQMPDLLLVSAILPGICGIDVCRDLRRAKSEVPIIVLSPRSDEIDVVVTLEMGADDFIAEPYGMRELVARVRAVLRRSNRPATRYPVPSSCERHPSGGRQPVPPMGAGPLYGLRPQAQPARAISPQLGPPQGGMPGRGGGTGPGILKVGDLSLDRARHEVLLRNRPIDLPRREFLLLEALLDKPGRLLTREVLIERIGGPGWGSRSVLSTLVCRLRARIESAAGDPPRIVTIRGLGYRYERTE